MFTSQGTPPPFPLAPSTMPNHLKLLPAPLVPLLLLGGTDLAPKTTGRPATHSVTVVVTGADRDGGQLGAALFSAAPGFPGDRAKAAQTLLRPRTAPVDSFVFKAVAPGTYAVSVYHDLNSNGKLDSNLFGVPKEPWGTTAKVRPSMRAPRFTEAQFDVTADTRIEIRVER